jgi:heavy metal sensor kinase
MKVPIRVRLTAVYCLAFFCSTVVLEIASYLGISAAIYEIVDYDLRARLRGVEGFLDEHIPRLKLARLQDEVRRHDALQPAHLIIRNASGDLLWAGDALQNRFTSEHPPVGSRGSVVIWTANAQPQSMRILATRRKILGRDYDLLLATSLTVPYQIMGKARLLLFLSAPLILLFASLAGYWISGRALAPVADVTRAARSIGAGSLARRIAVPDTGDELRDLALTLNEMLSRIDGTFRQVAQFTANASHELRTPLALIRTTAEVALLRKSASAATYREALHRVLAEAERNTALLDHLLFLARADAGQALIKRLVDVRLDCQRACEQMQLLANEKDIALRFETGDEPLWIIANSDHLRRLWLALLDNAVKYTAPGGRIDISVASTEPGSVSVEVIDTGIGIPEKDLPHIFERFFRADEARNKVIGGTGLGLSIARWVTEAHQATIYVHSVVGEGSVFRVVIPRVAFAAIPDPGSSEIPMPARTLTI